MEYKESQIKKLIPNRPKNSNKGTFGHVLNIAGSEYYTGAAYFSSISSLLVGAGRCTLATIPSVINKIAAFSPDIIYYPLKETENGTISPDSIDLISTQMPNFSTISIGCGLSSDRNILDFFYKFLSLDFDKPIIIDADGLNILSVTQNIKLPPKTVLTPHPKEMSRLINMEIDEILKNPQKALLKGVEKYHCTIVLKMHKTMILNPNGDFYINNTGNSALSHGGSGDVLCGMISGFIAQKLSEFDASCLAVYLHGLASELASKDLTEYSTLTSDLLKYIPKAINLINN